MAFYPDVILFDFTQTEYTRLWQGLNSANYIYAHAYGLEPTNWFMYAFQSVKGWFGFNNYCQSERVSYGLNKLAYYGYSQHFIQPDLAKLNSFPGSSDVLSLITQEHSPAITAQLQEELIRSYFLLEPYLNFNDYQRLSSNHCFGESWLTVYAIDLIPSLDPQNDSFILHLIKTLENTKFSNAAFVKNSKYAKMAALYYLTKAKEMPARSFLENLLWKDPRHPYLAKALLYHTKIAEQEPLLYIEYYLEKKEYTNALPLIGLLPDNDSILKYLLKIPESIQQAYIEKDSFLAAILAQHYLKQKKYAMAQRFCSSIEALDPLAAFSLAIQEKKYSHAYDVFKRFKEEVPFPPSECKALATVFFAQADKDYNAGRILRDEKEWETAKSHYRSSYRQKKIAQELFDCPQHLEGLYTHKRLYAQLLVDSDLALNQAETSDIAMIRKAINLLESCDSREKEEQNFNKTVLTKALMRRVDTLCEIISFDNRQPDPTDTTALEAHKKKYNSVLSPLINTLEEVIQLLNDTNDPSLKIQLGKAYFLHADIHHFFDIPNDKINHYYEKAMETVPNNPFYLIRASEIFETRKLELQNRGLKHLIGDAFTYLHWFDERWVRKEQMVHEVKDIHTVVPTNTSSWFNLGL